MYALFNLKDDDLVACFKLPGLEPTEAVLLFTSQRKAEAIATNDIKFEGTPIIEWVSIREINPAQIHKHSWFVVDMDLNNPRPTEWLRGGR